MAPYLTDTFVIGKLESTDWTPLFDKQDTSTLKYPPAYMQDQGPFSICLLMSHESDLSQSDNILHTSCLLSLGPFSHKRPGPVYLTCIRVTSEWARWRLKSPASRLFTQPFIQAQIKENIKAPRHWPFAGNSPGTGEFPAQMTSNTGNVSIWWRHHVGNAMAASPEFTTSVNTTV